MGDVYGRNNQYGDYIQLYIWTLANQAMLSRPCPISGDSGGLDGKDRLKLSIRKTGCGSLTAQFQEAFPLVPNGVALAHLELGHNLMVFLGSHFLLKEQMAVVDWTFGLQ